MAAGDYRLKQIQSEYTEGQDFLRSRKLRQVKQLVLLNNLRRGDENVSSTSLLSYFTRVISSLYDPNGTQMFVGSEDSDYKATEALKKLAISDSMEIDKAMLDYDWLWDTGFFGRGYVETLRFDKKRKLMLPEVLNPLMMIYDPYFAKPQDWRYYGKWILRSGSSIKGLIDQKIITGISKVSEIPGGIEQELWDYKVKREAAKEGTAPTDQSESPNGLYQIYEHLTHDKGGNKILVWSDKNFSKVLRQFPLELNDDPDNAKKSKWPIVMKEMFREPHSSLPVSIPDIVEDKHRAKNVLYNLMYIAAKDEANPILAYDVEMVQDLSQLLQRQVMQHIPVKSNGAGIDQAIAPIRKTPATTNSLLAFLNILNAESTEAIGTTQLETPAVKGKKNATQAAILQQIAELTQSLQARILAQGDKEYYSHWYQRYINNMKQGDIKIASITSVNGVTFENIELDKIRTKFPPKVLIKNSKEAEFKQMIDRREAMQYLPLIMNILKSRPQSILNYLKFVFLPMFLKDSSTIEQLIPNSIDEIKAQQENDILMRDETVPISPEDDDEQHMYIHYRAKKTAATWAHIFAHEYQWATKNKQLKEQEKQVLQQQMQKGAPGASGGQGGGQGGQPQDEGTPEANFGPGAQRGKGGRRAPGRQSSTAPLKDALSSIMAQVGNPQVK